MTSGFGLLVFLTHGVQDEIPKEMLLFLPPRLLFIKIEVMSVLLVDGNRLRDRAVGLILKISSGSSFFKPVIFKRSDLDLV